MRYYLTIIACYIAYYLLRYTTRLGLAGANYVLRQAGPSLLVIDFDNKFYSHYWSGVGGHTPVKSEIAQRMMTEYRTEIGSNLNKIYDNGFEVWVKQAACTT